MPVSASAGSMFRVAGAPECTPTPLTVAEVRRVVCLPAFIRSADPIARKTHVPPDWAIQSPDFAGKCGKANLRHPCRPPQSPGKIPFCFEHFSWLRNQRQLTLSYRVLPPNRRKAARNGASLSADRVQLPENARLFGLGQGSEAPDPIYKKLSLINALAKRSALLHRFLSGRWPRSRRASGDLGRDCAIPSVRLAAQEGRDLKLILIHSLLHRSLPAMLVEPLRRRPFGVFRNRLMAGL